MALKIDDLKKQIKFGLTNVYKPAIEQAVLMTFPEKSNLGDEMAKNIANAFDEMTSEQFADILASAIDYYVKNIDVTGMLITTGSPGTHTCKISAPPTPIMGGKIPNTLGIS